MSDDLGRFRDPPRDRPRSSLEQLPDGEVLDTGPARPVPRWLVLVGVLAVVAALVVVIARNGGGGAPVADPSTPTAPAPSPEQGVPNVAMGNAYGLVGDERLRRLFALSGNRLFAIGPNGQQIGHGAPVQVGGAGDDIELVLDAPHHILWAVPQNATGHDGSAAGFAEPFDTRTLHSYERLPLPGLVESAAVLDGDLYVTTDQGLWRTTTAGGPFEHIAGAASTGDALLVTDLTRHRLICVRFGSRATARTYRGTDGFSAPVTLPSQTISLAVVDGTIWLGGARHGRALLAMLDPSTLHVGPDLARGDVDVELQGTGRHSLYVSVGSRLQCLSGSSGELLRDLGPLRGAFASVAGRGFYGSQDALHPVAMGRCPG